jgi:ActR/RegA family two-component response regulator
MLARPVRASFVVGALRRTVLLCDEDRDHTESLAGGLEELGYAVEVVRTYAEAFGIACAHDVDALVVSPFVRDGSALVLPTALGIRRPRVVILMANMSERLAPAVARRLGFDAQLTKVVDAKTIDRVILSGTDATGATVPESLREGTPH